MIWVKQTKVEPSIVSKETSAPDDMVKLIQNFRNSAAMIARQQATIQQNSAIDAKVLIEKARKWVKETGVGIAACRLCEETRPWPAWSKREDWPNWNTLGVNEVDGGGSIVKSSYTIFTRGDHRWKFELTRQENYFPEDNQHRGQITVTFDGVDVLQISVVKDFSDYSDWRDIDVNGLIVGSWAPELVEMQTILEYNRKQRLADMEAKRVQEQAGKLKL